MNKAFLTSRELGMILGVSESSVKRWIDQGLVPASRTAGGHRRVALADAVNYVRENRVPVLNAGMLGFSETEMLRPDLLDEMQLEERLYHALETGDAATAYAMIHGPFLAGRPLAWIFDNPVRRCMARLGELWRFRSDGIMIEHRATDICMQAIIRLRSILEIPQHGTPLALGGAAPADSYVLAPLMASTVLREVGMRDINLGPDTPVSAMREAVKANRPRLVWYSFSCPDSCHGLEHELPALAAELEESNIPMIIGGRELGTLKNLRHRNIHIGHSMTELATLTRGLLAS
ncbi:MAG: hypothetical protein FWE88_06010 [Phycisphaerae bacterium]|nr:hypothetical protein [Phycisphaerae bacterium]